MDKDKVIKEILRIRNDNEEIPSKNDSSSVKYSFIGSLNDYICNCKLRYKLIKKQVRRYINKKNDKNFTNIVYLTADCPEYTPQSERLDSPINYIIEMRKQYPDINFCLLIPIMGLSENFKPTKKITVDIDNNFFALEKTSISFDFYSENKTFDCTVYKFNKNESNIMIFGIFSPAFSYLKNIKEITTFEKSVSFMKAARTVIKNLNKEGFNPDIVHSEFLPFFLGADFETKNSSDIKVFQVFDSIDKLEAQKQEPFWSVLNIADKQSMKKICADNGIQNNIARLFNLPIKDIMPKMSDCINLIYDNYKIFHKTTTNDSENKGDIIFRQLNNRIQKVLPGIIKKDEKYYYPFLNSLIHCDYWAVSSETYYNELFLHQLASPRIIKELDKTKDKSGFLLPAVGTDVNSKIKIYNNFDNENYREERIKNKKTLVKEFRSDSIKTKFIDETIFKDIENIKIYGYLDSFYDAPLLFANPDLEVYSNGTDVLFNTMLKLFERNRNIQIIISIQDGMKDGYISSVINFLTENQIFMGRWVFIDGEVNLPKMFSASDIFLYPARICDKYVKHMLGSHYGCIPVVSNSGILNDTVIDIFDNIAEGNGFKTKQSLLYEPENTNVYINCLEKALELYNNNPSSWNIIIKNNLTTDTEWTFSKLEHYHQIYQNIL